MGCSVQRLQKSGVGAVSGVAFTYDIYTTLSKNNGVLGATLTNDFTVHDFVKIFRINLAGIGSRYKGSGVPFGFAAC